MNSHQTTATINTGSVACILLIKIAHHYGYDLAPEDAVALISLIQTGAVYLGQFLAAKGVKLPPIPGEQTIDYSKVQSTLTASAAPAQPVT